MSSLKKRSLGVISISLINVAAVSSLRNLPIMSNCGLHLLFFYALATIAFFIPSAMVAAELATAYPNTKGGVYTWVKEGLGPKCGFLAAWCLMAKGFVYFPAVLAFIAGTIAFLLNPELADNKLYTCAIVLVVMWAGTLINYKGMQMSDRITTISTVLGTIIPGLFIVGLGLYWMFIGNPTEIHYTSKADLFPEMNSLGELAFLAGTFVGFAGMELSAAHAKDTNNPQKTYPKAILLSSLMILGIFVLGSLSIAMVVPQSKLSLDAGIMQAFANIFDTFKMPWLTPVIAVLVAGGAIGTIKTWIISPIQKLHATAENGDLPPYFQKVNKNGIPMRMLIWQAIGVSVFSSVFFVMPTINSAFWLLTALTAAIYMVSFSLMFPAAILLRYKRPDLERPFKVPGGNAGMWIVSGMGFLSTIFAFFIGFVPPSNLPMGDALTTILIQIGCTALICMPPFIFFMLKKDSWKPVDTIAEEEYQQPEEAPEPALTH